MVKLDLVKPGMVLSKPAVHASSGREILAAGRVIEDKDIRTLKSWGIHEVSIEGGDAGRYASPGNVIPIETPAVTDRMGQAFRFADLTHPLMAELHRLAQQRYAEYLLQRSAGSDR